MLMPQLNTKATMSETGHQQALPELSNPASVRDPGEVVRDAFRRRAEHAMEHIARSATIEALGEALSAPTDFGAVARALGDPAAFTASRPLDPLADAWARGAAERERLSAEAGGLLPAEDAGRALGGISRQAVDKRRRNRQLLGIRVGHDWRYPAVQIGGDGQAVPGMAFVLEGLAALGPWAQLAFLLAKDDALGGSTPMEALHRGGSAADEVRRIVRSHGSDAFG